jgi:glycogenin
MSRDAKPFVAPETYPEPPQNMWYEVPKEAPPASSQKPRAIFPWETHQPRPSRVFGPPPSPPQGTGEGAPSLPTTGEPMVPITAGRPAEPFATGSSTTEVEASLEPMTPTSATATSPQVVAPASFDPWASAAINAWDDVPAIHRYVERFADHAGLGARRRGADFGERGIPPEALKKQSAFGRGFFKVTDFPTAEERPSLPVTPAPGGRFAVTPDGTQVFPEAEGVPAQRDWVCVHGRRWGPADCLCDLTNVLRYYKNPIDQLVKLAKQQQETLRRLSGDEELRRDLPQRKLPYGSDDVLLPATTVMSSAQVLSPRPVKAGVGSKVRSFGEQDDEHVAATSTQPNESRPAPSWALPPRGEPAGHLRSGSRPKGGTPYPRKGLAEPPPHPSAKAAEGSTESAAAPKAHHGLIIPEPSYKGPSVGWEKGEGAIPAQPVVIPSRGGEPEAFDA